MMLTKSQIDKFEHQPSGSTIQVLADIGGCPGFGVRVYEAGSKSYVVRLSAEGKRTWFTIGPVSTIKLTDARQMAVELYMKAKTEGKSPAQARRQRAKSITWAELAPIYMERYGSKKKSGKADERLFKMANRHLGSRLLVQTTRDEVRKIHAQISKQGPYQANRLLALLKTAFTMAKAWELVPDDIVNPVVGVTRNREEKRDVFISEDQMPQIIQAIEAEESIFVQAAIWLYLLTGLRKTEVLSLRWSDVNLKSGSVTIRAEMSKNGKAHGVPLSKFGIDMLAALPRSVSGFVFPSTARSKEKQSTSYLKEIRTPWERILAAAGMEKVRLHDLRRTLGSWLLNDEVSMAVISRILNHSSTKVTEGHYAHLKNLADKPLRDALEFHSQKLVAMKRKSKS